MLAFSVNWPLILDYIQALVWPGLIGGIVIYVLRRYGDHIGKLIDRIKSFRAFGTETVFDPSQQQQQTDEEAEAVEEALADDEELIGAIQEMYEERLEAQQLEAAEAQMQLLRELAVKDLMLDFERIYRVIYGSQIAALRTLQATPGGAHRAALEAHLTQVRATWTLIPWIQRLTFEEWMGYLLREDLAVAVGDGSDTYLITQKGSAFLHYIDAGAYPARVF